MSPRRGVPAIVFAMLLVAPGSALGERQDGGFDKAARVSEDSETGSVQFVGTRPGRPIPRPSGFGPSSSPAAVGRAFLQGHAAEFGLRKASVLRTEDSVEQGRGVTAVRYQQAIEGVEVLGGELVVQLDRDNDIVSAIGEVTPTADIDAQPRIGEAEARRLAIAAVAKEESRPDEDFSTGSDVALRVFDPRIMGGPGLPRASVVWAVTVSDGDAVRRQVFVDAELGAIAASIDEIHSAKNRTICDAGGVRAALSCPSPVLIEGGNTSGHIADVQDAYAYSGATYDFFHGLFNRDSLDGQGMLLKSTVRYCDTDPADSCPYNNAFWNGEQMVYGQGYASADDVVGHELAHGLTEHTSNLFYYYQSGAINESLSDVFGELIDQATSSPDDDVTDRWKVGESLSIGSIRNMANPPLFSDPDSMTSANYWTAETDSGGVHINSGINNKAAFLITDGGSFNGQTITALGAEKTARLYYAVQTGFLTSASDFADLGRGLGQACDNLVGSNGFVADDCVQVRKVVTATAMLTERTDAGSGAVDQVVCTGADPTSEVFSDDMEGAPRWTAGPEWYLPEPVGATWATSGTNNMLGRGTTAPGTYSMTLNSAITVPASGFLRFRHAYLFEHDTSGNYDGGRVEYSANNGATWIDAVPAGIYSGSISADYDNPLRGQRAFAGYSHGYVTTVVPLSELAGQSIRVRFTVASDTGGRDYGWFIDDVSVGGCGTPGEFAIDASAGASEAAGGTVVVSRSVGSGFARVRLSTTSAGTATSGSDFTALAQTVTFNGSETTKTVPVAVIDDSLVEGPESVGLALSEPVGGTIATATGTLPIADNDVAPQPQPAPAPAPVPVQPTLAPPKVVPAVPTVGFARVQKANGVRLTVVCATTCTGRATAKVSKALAERLKLKSRVVGVLTLKLDAGTRTVQVRFKKSVLERLRAARVRKARFRVAAALTDTAGGLAKLQKSLRIAISRR